VVAGLPNVCSIDYHVGALPLAVLHQARQSITSISTALSITEVSHDCPVENHIVTTPLAVLRLAHQSITMVFFFKIVNIYTFTR
jgi:hypothetical protein